MRQLELQPIVAAAAAAAATTAAADPVAAAAAAAASDWFQFTKMIFAFRSTNFFSCGDVQFIVLKTNSH